jgi:hypothetical protein
VWIKAVVARGIASEVQGGTLAPTWDSEITSFFCKVI